MPALLLMLLALRAAFVDTATLGESVVFVLVVPRSPVDRPSRAVRPSGGGILVRVEGQE